MDRADGAEPWPPAATPTQYSLLDDARMSVSESALVIACPQLGTAIYLKGVSHDLYDDPVMRARARDAGVTVVVGKHEGDERLLAAIRSVATPAQ